jgi:hypothetical protein
MSNIWYRNQPISKEKARVFQPANRCIYCIDGKPPFTREHVIPRGLGGGIIYPNASCEECREIIRDLETYCMRGPWLSHRLNLGLVKDLKDLGTAVKMPIMINGERQERTFTPEEFPNYLILPEFHDPPGITIGRMDGTGRFSFAVWGDEQIREMYGDGEGNAILAERFDLNRFARAIAKIAHGFVAGEYGLDNFMPFLTPFILGVQLNLGDALVGNWGEDGMEKDDRTLHQIGVGFVQHNEFVRVDVRLRLFAAYEKSPVYRIIAGVLTKPIDEVLAPHGLRSGPPNA